MSRSHGLVGEFAPQAWAAPARTPLFHPDAVTPASDADASAVVARIGTSTPGACVMDGFADLDLSEAGFSVLFDAQWIHRPAGAPRTRPDLAWEVAEDPDALRDWSLAWDGGDGAAWPLVLEAVHQSFPSLPAVGDEQGEDLDAAVRHGFGPIGPLRVGRHG